LFGQTGHSCNNRARLSIFFYLNKKKVAPQKKQEKSCPSKKKQEKSSQLGLRKSAVDLSLMQL